MCCIDYLKLWTILIYRRLTTGFCCSNSWMQTRRERKVLRTVAVMRPLVYLLAIDLLRIAQNRNSCTSFWIGKQALHEGRVCVTLNDSMIMRAVMFKISQHISFSITHTWFVSCPLVQLQNHALLSNRSFTCPLVQFQNNPITLN